LKNRDAGGVGLPSAEGRDLLRRLLAWSPRDRILAHDALAHPWFDDGAQLPPLRAIQKVSRGRRITPAGTPWQEDEGHQWEHDEFDVVDQDEDVCLSSAFAEPFASAADKDHESLSSGGARGRGPLASGCPSLSLHAAAHSERGRRTAMEDRHVVFNLSTSCGESSAETSFIGVYDGHGGAEVADRLQKSLHQHIMADPAFPTDLSDALVGAFESFDQYLEKDLTPSPSEEYPNGPGSTALAALTTRCRLYIANLGDCRAVLARHDQKFGIGGSAGELWPLGALIEIREAANSDLRGQRGLIVEVRSASKKLYVVRLLRDGALRPMRQAALRLLSELRAQRLTQDHKPDTASERQRIEALGGKVEERQQYGANKGPARVAGIATSRSFGSLGAKPFVSARPDLYENNLSDRDAFVVFASDGVWDVLEDQLVVDLIWDLISSVHDSRLGPTAALAEAAQLIIQTAMDRGSLDNLTCVILMLGWAACAGENCSDFRK